MLLGFGQASAGEFDPGQSFQDCVECPEMVVIPAGTFSMGDLGGGGDDDEKPVHTVTIPNKFAVGRFEVTRGEFATFVNATGYNASGECYFYTGGNFKKARYNWKESRSHDWRSPGFGQTDRDPVVCMNWDDARAYVRWLSPKTGKEYRLLSEAEWEYMARAGGTAKYPFGDSEESLCEYGNGGDRSTGFAWKNESCNDGYGAQTAPVGSFKPNSFSVFDTVGNVWEWIEACQHKSYSGAPSDGSAWTSGSKCNWRVLRGGSWATEPRGLRSADRRANFAVHRVDDFGFRVARTLD